jgi:hypothetical protein
LYVGGTYIEYGATCTDNSGNCSVVTTGSVNTAIAGTYTITYTATDRSSNSAQATRSIVVNAPAVINPVENVSYANRGSFVLPPFNLSPQQLEALKLKNIPAFSLNVGTNQGVTKFGDILKDLNSPDPVKLKPLTSVSFKSPLASFIFAPLPDSFLKLAEKSATVKTALSIAKVTGEKDLVKLMIKPLSLPTIAELDEKSPTDLIFAETAAGMPIRIYLTSDKKSNPVFQLSAEQGQLITFIVFSKKDIVGMFDEEKVDFTLRGNTGLAATTVKIPTGQQKHTLLLETATSKIRLEVVPGVRKVEESKVVDTPTKSPSIWQKIIKFFGI